MMKKALFFVVFLSLWANYLKAQDPIYSQYWIDKLYLNPALAGSEKGFDGSMMLRYQWPNITSQFANYSVSLSGFEPNIGGWGFSAMQNVEGEGVQKTTEVSISYAMRVFPLNKRWDLSFGLRTGFIQRKIDFSKLVFSDQLDPVNGVIYDTKAELPPSDGVLVFNANTGMNFRWFVNKRKRTFVNIGISLNNVTSPHLSLLMFDDTRLPIRYIGYASVLLPINPNSGRFSMGFRPMFMHTRQGNFSRPSLALTMAGFQTSTDRIFGGAFYRSREIINVLKRDGLFFNAGFFFSIGDMNLSTSYGYEINISRLATNTGGSHEISLTMNYENFLIFKKLSSVGRRRLKHCPDFRVVGGLKSL
jgi:type IX secretion system PorP/SprF family membrane protein